MGIAGETGHVALELLWPQPGRRPLPFIIQSLLVLLGFMGGFVALVSVVGLHGWLSLTIGASLVLWGAGQRRAGLPWLSLRWISRLLHSVALGFIVYQALAFGSMLAWSVAAWIKLLVVLTAVGAAASSWRPVWGLRVPVLLPLGIWISACIFGWFAEDDSLRCVDRQRVIEQDDVAVILPSTGAQERCEEGRRLRPKGYPRMVYETEEAGRYLVAVDVSQAEEPSDPTSRFTGGLCEVQIGDGGGKLVHCALDGLYHLSYDRAADEIFGIGPAGVLKLSGRPPFRVLARGETDGRVPTFVVHLPDLAPDTVTVFFDDLSPGLVYSSDRLERHGTTDWALNPAQMRYDPARGEGVYCFASMPLFPINGLAYLALAFRGDPGDLRLLGSSAEIPWSWLAFSDGCDLDPSSRRAFSSIATLGVVAVMDYDLGSVLDAFWAGFGIRSIVLDPARQRLYTSNYFTGAVLELDAKSGQELRRWFVGRFVRHVSFSEDRSSLYATSTVGLVGIQLEGSPQP